MNFNPAWRYFEPPPEEKDWHVATYWTWDPESQQGMWIYADGHTFGSVLDFTAGSKGWIEVFPDPDLQMDIGL